MAWSKVKIAVITAGALLVAGGGAFVGVSVVQHLRVPSGETFVLSDGSRVTLRGVTVGTNSSFLFGTPLQRVLARLPGKVGEKRDEYSLRSFYRGWHMYMDDGER